MPTSGSKRIYGGRSGEDRRTERRRRFLDAALSVFTDKSFTGSTVTDICAEAGLSRRQFYEEFASREALLIALYDEIQQEAANAITEAFVTPSTDVKVTATAVMTAYVTAIGTDARRAKVAFVEIVGVNETIEQHRLLQRRQWATTFETLLTQLVGPQITPPGGYAMSASAFIGAVNGLVYEWTLTTPRPPSSDLVNVLTTILLALVTV